MMIGLRGAVPPPPFSMNPAEDFALKAAWSRQYFSAAEQFANEVVQALASSGFSVAVFGNPCDPNAGCIGLYSLQASISKDGRSMDASIGNPVRFDSPSEEAAYIAELFSIYSVPTQQYTVGFQVPSQPVQPIQTPWNQPAPTQPAAPATSTTAAPAQSSVPATTAAASPAAQTQTQTQTVSQQEYVFSSRIEAPEGYVVGAPWRIIVTGMPNQPVSVRAYQDGKDLGQTQYGYTNASGVFVMDGVFTQGTEGRWVEHWYVGSQPAGTLTFTVLPAAARPQPGETATQTTQTAPQTQTAQTAPQQTQDGGVIQMQTGGIGISAKIPVWGWLALAGGAIFFLSRSGK